MWVFMAGQRRTGFETSQALRTHVWPNKNREFREERKVVGRGGWADDEVVAEAVCDFSERVCVEGGDEEDVCPLAQLISLHKYVTK